MAFEIDSIVKYKTFSGEFIIKASKDNPYDGRNSSPFHALIKVKEGYDYKIAEIKEDGSFSDFIDAKEDELSNAN